MLFEKKILKAIQCEFIVRYLGLKTQINYEQKTLKNIFKKCWLISPAFLFSLSLSIDLMQLSKTPDTSTWSWSSVVVGRSGPNSKKCEKTEKSQ